MPRLRSRPDAVLLVAGLLAVCVATPATRQSVSFELLSRLDGPAEMVATDGRRAYVSAGQELRVVDISDRSRPMFRGSFSLPDRVYGWQIVGQHAYLALGLEGLHIVDLTDPDAPTLIGVHETAGQALGVSTHGRMAMVVNLMSGLEVVDVSDGSTPTLVATQDTPGYQWGVGSLGPRVFVVDQPSGIHLFDVSSPTAPTLLGMHPTPRPATAVTATDSLAYVVYGWTGSIELLDFTDPAAPVSRGSYQPSGRPQRVIAVGSRLYAPVGEPGLEVIDVSDPSMPGLLATYDTPGNALDVAVHDDLIVVADESGLVVLRH